MNLWPDYRPSDGHGTREDRTRESKGAAVCSWIIYRHERRLSAPPSCSRTAIKCLTDSRHRCRCCRFIDAPLSTRTKPPYQRTSDSDNFGPLSAAISLKYDNVYYVYWSRRKKERKKWYRNHHWQKLLVRDKTERHEKKIVQQLTIFNSPRMVAKTYTPCLKKSSTSFFAEYFRAGLTDCKNFNGYRVRDNQWTQVYNQCFNF